MHYAKKLLEQRQPVQLSTGHSVLGLNLDKLLKSQNLDGKVKSSSSRRREFCGMRRTDVRRSEHEMKRNAEIGLFTKPSTLILEKI
jgi:hypothetical protein